jgi:hypothetical protein
VRNRRKDRGASYFSRHLGTIISGYGLDATSWAYDVCAFTWGYAESYRCEERQSKAWLRERNRGVIFFGDEGGPDE